MPARKRSKAPPELDAWSKFFNALIQIVGLAMFVYQGVFKNTDRPWLLAMCGALMIGGFGLRLFVKGATGVLSAAAVELDEGSDE